jgi:hypothetical protein
MSVATKRIYRGQKALPVQDRLSINALDFHEPVIDSTRIGTPNCARRKNKKPASTGIEAG